MRNKILSVLAITFVLCACLLALTACDSPTKGVKYQVSEDGTYAEVIGYSGTSTKVNIASTYKGLPVKNIGSFAFKDTAITTVVIPDSVTSISNSAFSCCSSLTSITIPDSVKSIGEWAFYYCSNLTSVIIGNSVTSIGGSAFYGSGLTSITIPNSVTSIGDSAFRHCNSLASITFKDTTHWYRTTSYYYWKYKTGGTQTDVTSSSANATNFKSTYCEYYWYKE